MKNRHKDGVVCIGVACDVCAEKDCAGKMQIVDGLKLCPVCIFKLTNRTPVRKHGHA